MSGVYFWNGRPVTFVEFNIKAGREVRAAWGVDPERGMYTTLLHSIRYADDHSPVFKSLDEIDAQPFRLQQRILMLAGVASETNKQEEVEKVDDAGNVIPLH